MNAKSTYHLSCPIPKTEYEHILLAHGGGGKLTRQIYELGCIAARSAEQLGLAVDYSGDRAVAAITDRPIVGEEMIGNIRKPFSGCSLKYFGFCVGS